VRFPCITAEARVLSGLPSRTVAADLAPLRPVVSPFRIPLVRRRLAVLDTFCPRQLLAMAARSLRELARGYAHVWRVEQLAHGRP